MARIIEENANTTIDLADALAALEDAAQAANLVTPQECRRISPPTIFRPNWRRSPSGCSYYPTARAAPLDRLDEGRHGDPSRDRRLGGRLPAVPRMVGDIEILQ